VTDRELMRHAIAVIAYRGGKPLRNAPETFAEFKLGEGGNTPLALVSHLADLMEWALTQLEGQPRFPNRKPTTWQAEVDRFYAALRALDAYLASDQPIQCDLERLLAGPVADSINHIGQLMMLRRLAGSAVYGENYFVADIVTGRVGKEQSPPVKPF